MDKRVYYEATPVGYTEATWVAPGDTPPITVQETHVEKHWCYKKDYERRTTFN